MRLLFLANLGSDYGEAMLVKGLFDLLGPERLVLWPFKRTYTGHRDHYPERCVGDKHYLGGGGWWSEKWTDPSLYRAWLPERHPNVPAANDGPLHFMTPLALQEFTAAQVFDFIRRKEIALVVLGSVRWHSSIALTELRETFHPHHESPLPPVVLVDGEDYFQMRWDFVNEFHPRVYFKRTLLCDGHPRSDLEGNRTGVPVRPLPFSSLWDLEWVPWEERTTDLFCVFGRTQILRQKVHDTALEVAQQFPGLRVVNAVGHPLSHPEYLDALRHSKIVIDHQRMGTDTVRFWEAASAGACVLSDLWLKFEPPLHPGTHYYQYENDMTPEGDQQKFDIFRQRLHQALSQDADTHRMARALYDEVRSRHRARDRARWFLQQIRAAGVDLKDLPS